MIISNLEQTRLRAYLEENKLSKSSADFINSVYDLKVNENITRTDSLSYSNIKGISLEEIDTLFKDEESKSMAKNLRLATLFSADEKLSHAMFNTVLGKPFSLGYDFLYNSYEDKHVFFNADRNSLSSLLHESLGSRLDLKNSNSTDVIPQDRLDEILLEVQSFNFLDSLSRTSKDQYGRYKDKKDDYSFLYGDLSLKYEELRLKYEEYENVNKMIIQQYK